MVGRVCSYFLSNRALAPVEGEQAAMKTVAKLAPVHPMSVHNFQVLSSAPIDVIKNYFANIKTQTICHVF